MGVLLVHTQVVSMKQQLDTEQTAA